MKKVYALLLCFILISNFASATIKFWVGPLNGKWSSSANWSLISGGGGGAGTPGSTDDLNFTNLATIVVDTQTVVHSIYTHEISGKVLLIANINTSITITGVINIAFGSYIKDSTTANVPFDVNFIKGASANIQGDWIFEGGTPVTPNNGASFSAPLGTFVDVSKAPVGVAGGRIICNKNCKTIGSSNSTLHFGYSSFFVSDNVLAAVIPYATWAKDSINQSSSYDGILVAPASTILLSGNLTSIHHPEGGLSYGRMVINLATLSADAGLALPDGCRIKGNLEIQSTNNHNLALLSSYSATSNVTVIIGTTEAGQSFGGNLLIDGNSRVAIANATGRQPGNNFKLQVNKGFKQTGGNFSLQDEDGATGTSTLDITNDLIETGGTFITNSTATGASTKFRVIMNDPTFNTGPSGNFNSSRIISMSSGTIDNGRNMVILKIDHSVYNIPLYTSNLNGVILKSPLTVGRLELARSPLTTTLTNILTVTDPAVNAITVLPGMGNNYINGPLRRATNSTGTYCFPTGKGNTKQYDGYVFDSCQVIPTTAVASMYQAEYFNMPNLVVTATAPLKAITPNKHWTIDRINGSAAKITLFIHNPIAGAVAIDGIVVANYVSPYWVRSNGNVLSPGNVSSGNVTSAVTQSFGMFTLGYGTASALRVYSRVNDLSAINFAGDAVSNAKIMQDETKVGSVYPNPFNDNFTMEVYNAGKASANSSVNIYDLKGSLVFSQKITNLAAGENNIRVNVSSRNLPAANYVGQLNIDGVVTATVKLLKAK